MAANYKTPERAVLNRQQMARVQSQGGVGRPHLLSVWCICRLSSLSLVFDRFYRSTNAIPAAEKALFLARGCDSLRARLPLADGLRRSHRTHILRGHRCTEPKMPYPEVCASEGAICPEAQRWSSCFRRGAFLSSTDIMCTREVRRGILFSRSRKPALPPRCWSPSFCWMAISAFCTKLESC